HEGAGDAEGRAGGGARRIARPAQGGTAGEVCGAAEAADDPVVAVARRTPGEEEEGRAEASATGPLRPLQLRPCHRQGVPEGRGSALAPAPVEARLRSEERRVGKKV